MTAAATARLSHSPPIFSSHVFKLPYREVVFHGPDFFQKFVCLFLECFACNYVNVLYLCLVLLKARNGHGCPGARTINVCEMLGRCREVNPGPLQDQQVL